MLQIFRELLAGLNDEAPRQAYDEHTLQLAAAALLIEISRADNEVTAEECEAIQQAITSTYDLNVQEASELIELAEGAVDESVSFYDFTHRLNEALDYRQRIAIVRMLWQVACADGHIDRYEDYYIRKIADLLYVPHSEFIRTKLQVMEALS